MLNSIIVLFNMKREEIESFQTSRTSDEVIISIKLYRQFKNCVDCESSNVTIHGYKIRVINHSALDNIKCTIHYNARRFKCKDCKKTFFEDNSFVSDRQRISKYTVIKVLRELKIPNYTFANVAKNTGLSKTAVINIFDQYVEYSRRSLPEYLCIDEVYYSRHAREKYNCVLYDFRKNEIVDCICQLNLGPLISWKWVHLNLRSGITSLLDFFLLTRPLFLQFDSSHHSYLFNGIYKSIYLLMLWLVLGL